MPISPARVAAFDILLRVESTDAYASELLHSSRTEKLSPADHGLTTEIVMGVLRWRSVLDEQLSEHADRPLAKFDAEVMIALRIGTYQLLFLDRIPPHAAINESVELVKRARKRSAAGMVNAILRRLSTQSPTLPSVARDESALKAHPAWLIQRWEQAYGSAAQQAICSYDQEAPGTVIRADAKVLEELAAEGVRLEPGKLLKNAYAGISGDIIRTRAFRERRLVVQDEGSQLVALLLGRGQRILDCCAAPGGKTRIIAGQNPQGTVVAMELHAHRAALMKRLVPVPNVHVVAADARAVPFSAQFDRILVDAPCSGTGTLARNPDIKWRLKPASIERMQAYQLEILVAAMKQLAPGGQLLYSTCSLEPEENEAVVERAMEGATGFRVLDIRGRLNELGNDGLLVLPDLESLVRGPYLRTIPGIHPCDGFFAALLERGL